MTMLGRLRNNLKGPCQNRGWKNDMRRVLACGCARVRLEIEKTSSVNDLVIFRLLVKTWNRKTGKRETTDSVFKCVIVMVECCNRIVHNTIMQCFNTIINVHDCIACSKLRARSTSSACNPSVANGVNRWIPSFSRTDLHKNKKKWKQHPKSARISYSPRRNHINSMTTKNNNTVIRNFTERETRPQRSSDDFAIIGECCVAVCTCVQRQ